MIAEQIDNDLIRGFLKSTSVAKYNLYPGVVTEDIWEYSMKLLGNSHENGKLFIAQSISGIEAIVTFKILEWDSTHYGFKCAVIDQYLFNQELEQQKLVKVFDELMSDILRYAKSEGVKFISMSVNSWDIFISTFLQQNDFKYILTWIDGVFLPSSPLPITCPEHEIGLIRESEIHVYQKIAENHYFKGGRFYLDRNFDRNLVNKMYSELVLSSFQNEDIMLSYRMDGEPAGLFVSKKIQSIGNQNRIRIAPLRFLVIRNDLREKNIGKELFSGTLNYLIDKCDLITTGLEVHNLPSLNLHSRLNFKFNYTHNIFHWWAK